MKRSVLAVLVLSLAMASPARATEESGEPSMAWPVAGGLFAAGGAALVFRQARGARTGDASCVWVLGGCYWLGVAGTLGEEAGGALLAYWGWRLGEHAYAEDHGKDVGGMKTFGLVAGGAAVVTVFAAQTYLAFSPLGCFGDGAGGRDYKCLGSKQYTAQIIGLSAVPVLLVAAPIASYAFGYESARRKAGQGQALTWRLAPMTFRDGAGLTLAGRF